MSLIRGENVIVAEYSASLLAYVLYGCARSCTLTLATDTIETSTVGQGAFATFIPTKHSFTGSLEGLADLGGTQILSLADLRAKQIAKTKLRIMFQRTAENGNVYTDEGDFYLVNSSDSGPYDNMNTYSIEMKGTGLLTQVFTPNEILANVKRFQYSAVGGETLLTSFTNALGGSVSLVGKTVLGFEKDGIGFSPEIFSGTPVEKEFKFSAAAGSIEIAIPLEAGEKCFGYYR